MIHGTDLGFQSNQSVVNKVTAFATKQSVFCEELKRALSNRFLQLLIKGNTGCFSIKYNFINGYLNFINLLESNPNYISVIKTHNTLDITLDIYKIFNIIDRIFKLIKKILARKTYPPVDVLFISRDRQVKVKTKSGYMVGDYIFYNVIDELKRVIPECRIQLFIINDKFDYLTIRDYIKSIYITLQKFIEWRIFRNRFIETQRNVNVNDDHIILATSFFFHPFVFLGNALLGYNIGRLLAVIKPKVIVSNDDCMYTRPIGCNAKVIVLQSSRITEYLEELRKYIFLDNNLKPDYFLASGPAFGTIKKRCQAAENVIVTGLPRYDILASASKIYSKPEFLYRYNISSSHKIIHWSTQCHVLSDEENAANFAEIFGAMRYLKDVTLVIKQHPAENERYTNLIQKYVADYGISAIIPPKDSDTYEQLYVCDLMITKNSTTAIEAVALGKPVIILNLSGKPDIVEYVNEGVALGVYKPGCLLPAIENLLKNDSELGNKRKNYIENYLYKIDGKATERVVDIIVKSLADFSNGEIV